MPFDIRKFLEVAQGKYPSGGSGWAGLTNYPGFQDLINPPPPTGGGGGKGGGDQAAGYNLPPGAFAPGEPLYGGLPAWQQRMLAEQVFRLGGMSYETIDLYGREHYGAMAYIREKGIRIPDTSGYGITPSGYRPTGREGTINKVLGSTAYRGWRDQNMARLMATAGLPGRTDQEQRMVATSIEQGYGAGGRTSGFVPSQEPYMSALEGTLEEFAATLGVGREAFESNLAARGVGGAGQAPGAYYRDVAAPVVRAGGQAVRESYLDYLNAYQRGSIAQEQLSQQAAGAVTGAEFQTQQIRRGQEATNLNRLLQAYLGQGRIQLGFAGLAQEQKQFGVEMAFRSYENKLRWQMFQMELQQRESESRSNFWSDLFGGLFDIGTSYLLYKGMKKPGG